MSIRAEGVPVNQNPAADLWGRLVDAGFAVLDAKITKELEDVETIRNPEPPHYNRIHHQDETRKGGEAIPNSVFTMQNLQGAALVFAALTLGIVFVKKAV